MLLYQAASGEAPRPRWLGSHHRDTRAAGGAGSMAKLLPPSSCPLAELPHPLPGSVSLAQALPGDSSAWGCCTKPEGRLKSSAPHQSDSAIHRTISMITAKSEISQGEITTGLSLLHNELQETPWWPSPNTGKVFSMHHQHCCVCLGLFHRNPKHPVEQELSARTWCLSALYHLHSAEKHSAASLLG